MHGNKFKLGSIIFVLSVPLLWTALDVAYILFAPEGYCFLRPMEIHFIPFLFPEGSVNAWDLILILLFRVPFQIIFLAILYWKYLHKRVSGSKGTVGGKKRGLKIPFWWNFLIFSGAVHILIFWVLGRGVFSPDLAGQIVGLLSFFLTSFFFVFPDMVIFGGISVFVGNQVFQALEKRITVAQGKK